MQEQKCERVDNVEERTLLVVTVLRGKGTKEDVCRLVELYYEKDREGNYHFLWVCQEKCVSNLNITKK